MFSDLVSSVNPAIFCHINMTDGAKIMSDGKHTQATIFGWGNETGCCLHKGYKFHQRANMTDKCMMNNDKMVSIISRERI